MGISAIYSGSCSILAWVSTILLGIGLLVELIVGAYWWSYLNPFGAHYGGQTYAQYVLTLMTWIFALISLVFLIFIVISNFLIPACADNGCCSCTLITFFDIFTIITMLIGLVTGIFGLLPYKYTIVHASPIPNEEFKLKCQADLVLHCTKAVKYTYENQDKLKDYGDWLYKFFKKAIDPVSKISKEDFIDGMSGVYTQYAIGLALKSEEEFVEAFMTNAILRADGFQVKNDLCTSVGAPLLVFAIVLFVALIMFCCTGCCCCCGNKAVVSGGGY